MPERRRGSGGSRQPGLFARSKQPKISLPDNHPMVVLTDRDRFLNVGAFEAGNLLLVHGPSEVIPEVLTR